MSGKQPNGQFNGAATKDDSGTNRLRTEGGKDGARNFGGAPGNRRMISELERINALNLEPSLPKQEDGRANVSRLNQNREALKGEFQNFLKTLQSNDSKEKGKSQVPAPSGGGGSTDRGPSTSNNMAAQKQLPAPNTGGGGPQNPQFVVHKNSSDTKQLGSILDAMLHQASGTPPDTVGPDWPEAKGPSFHDVLGEPGQMKAPNNQMPQQDPHQQQQQQHMQRSHNNNHSNQNSRPPQDQSQQQMRPNMPPPGGQQPNMPQGYVMAGPGGPQGGNQMMFPVQGQPQMFQNQMMGMQGMMVAPGQGGPQQGQMMPMQGMPQGGMMPGQNVMMMPGQMPQGMMPHMGGQGGQGGNDQQGQQMMFMPVMMAADPSQQGMYGQGMQQGFNPQGGPGNQQQGPYMMPQQMYHQQGQQN